MIASIVILALLSVVQSQLSVFNAGGSCYFMSDMLPVTKDCKKWSVNADAATSPIKGFYVKDSQGFYKRFDNPECRSHTTNSLYVKKNGGGFYMAMTRSKTNSNAEFRNCNAAGLCQNYYTGPGYSPSITPKVSITAMRLPASRCTSLKGPSLSANAVDEEQDDVQTDMALLYDAAEKEQSVIFDQGMDNSYDMKYNPQPLEFEPQPQPQPADNSFTLSFDKWSVLILALIFANCAVIMAIMYCREKNRNNEKY